MNVGRRRASGDVRLIFVLLLLLLVLSVLAAVVSGKYPLPLVEAVRILASRLIALEQTWTKRMEDVVLLVRLPRIVGAMLVGGALALALAGGHTICAGSTQEKVYAGIPKDDRDGLFMLCARKEGP